MDLHKLSLARNQLLSVPKEILNSLHGLRTLDLSFCELKGLPTHWNLPNLQSLYLNENCLEYFPDEVSNVCQPSTFHVVIQNFLSESCSHHCSLYLSQNVDYSSGNSKFNSIGFVRKSN